MAKRTDIKSILIIGAGPIIIGQACEFDYSGAQACKALRDEGYKVILVNSNPATIMTDPMMADRVYLLPLNVESIETILMENQIDAVLPTMGGQTALNLAKEAEELGIWEKYNVRLIGVDIKAIDIKDQAYCGSDAQLYASAVVPIAIPLTVGAGTFSAVILFANLADQATAKLNLLAAIAALVLVNHLVFSFSTRIVRFAGEAGLSIFTKIMGLFTLAIGVEFILRGLGTVYRQLH